MKDFNLRKKIFQIIKILIGLLLLFLSFRSIDWGLFAKALFSASPIFISLAVLSVTLSLGLKLWRWHLLLENFKVKMPFSRLVTSYFLGQAANILLVLRAGELVRIGWAHQAKEQDLVEITGSIAIEKYLDLLMFVLSMLVVSTALPEIVQDYIGTYQTMAIVASLGFVFAVLLGPWVWKKLFVGRVWKGWLGKVADRLDLFINASNWLRHPEKVGLLIIWSTIIWIVMGMTNWLLFNSLKLSLGWQAAGLVLIFVYIGVLPALMPGNIGPFTYFAQLALLPFAVELSSAVAFAVLLYVIVNLPPLLIAGVMMLAPKYKNNVSSKLLI